MENLNAEKIYKELAMFIEDMPTELHLGFKRTAKFREFLKDALSLIKSQEQKIFNLENRIKECENGYEGTLHLDRCKLHDAEEKINELGVDLKAMRSAANSYKIHNKKLTDEIKRLEKLCALRDQDNKDTQDLLYKAEAKNTELEKKYALAVAEREADVKGFSKMLAVIHDYTVQKMQDRFNKVFGGMDATQVLLRRTFDQIAREEMENEKETKGL